MIYIHRTIRVTLFLSDIPRIRTAHGDTLQGWHQNEKSAAEFTKNSGQRRSDR